MLFEQLKQLVNDYENRSLPQKFLSLFRADREVMAALRQFVYQLTLEGYENNDYVTYEKFRLFVLGSRTPHLMTQEYLQSDNFGSGFFRQWMADVIVPLPLREIEIPSIQLIRPNSLLQLLEYDLKLPKALPDFHQAEHQVGVNRGPGPKTLNAREIFLGDDVPPVNYYRLQVLNRLFEENGKVELRHFMQNTSGKPRDIASFDNDVKIDVEGDVRYGEIPMRITLDWQPIPSLTPYDKIIALAAEGDLEILESVGTTNSCYIRSKTHDDLTVTLKMNIVQDYSERLNFDRPLPTSESAEQFIRSIRFQQNQGPIQIPRGISEAELVGAIVNLLRTFHEIDPNDDVLAAALKNAKSDYEVFNLRLENHVGICCDRSMLFMMFVNRLGLTANYLSNDAHAFIEYLIDDRWHQVCVGGGKCDVQIKKLPYLKKFKVKINDISSAIIDTSKLFKPQPLIVENTAKAVSILVSAKKRSSRTKINNNTMSSFSGHPRYYTAREVWFDKNILCQYSDEDLEMCLSSLRASDLLWTLMKETDEVWRHVIIELEKPDVLIAKITTILSDRKNARSAQAGISSLHNNNNETQGDEGKKLGMV